MKKNEKKVPFFANLLEKQLAPKDVKGGDKGKEKASDYYRDNPTLKYPSDNDEPTFEPEWQGW